MAKTVHHGGKVGAAGKTLASNSSGKSAKSKAGTTLANHKNTCHKQYDVSLQDLTAQVVRSLICIETWPYSTMNVI